MIEEINTFVVNEFATNSYLYKDPHSNSAVLIDPGGKANEILEVIKSNNINVEKIILTHGHYDHIKDLENFVKNLNVEVLLHREEYEIVLDDTLNLSNFLEVKLSLKDKNIKWVKVEDTDIITCGKQRLYVLHTPGHTKGSICLYIKDRYLFTGDTLFCGSVGRTDFPTGDLEILDKSLKRIFSLSPYIQFFPGHNNNCILSEEMLHNPFI
ncbi:MAG: MBL fold metallo-hydrolase [Endomicrobia bacterium]|nr:MBL fold metallo-hydrolase [Endomicrobiia bacterium]